MAEDTGQQPDTKRLPAAGREKAAKRGSNFLGNLFGSMIATVVVEQGHVATRSYPVDVKITQLAQGQSGRRFRTWPGAMSRVN